MTQTAVASKREALLERVVDYVLQHGIADLTLRSLAAEVGSNNRMLLYYFGSRDELIVAALNAAESRFPSMTALRRQLNDDNVPAHRRLADAWTTLSAPQNLAYHRLFFQVFGLAGFESERFSPLLAAIGTEWAAHVAITLESTGLNVDDAVTLAHEVVAMWRGLQVTLISTGDHALVDRVAAEALAEFRKRIPEGM